jgi:glucose 1-dehydrogenase
MGEVTLVTGGSRGIGAAVAVRLAAAGHRVGIGYERAMDAAEDVARRIREEGGECLLFQVDTSDAGQVDAFFDAVKEDLGPVTGLVNNAGVTGPFGRLADTDPADLRRVVEVNLLGTLLCSRRAAQVMTARGNGVIVNVSSSAATLGSPGDYVHYAATKAAVDALTLGLAKELGPDGIRVNAVAPGIIDTEIHARTGDPDRARRVAASIPLRRPGQAEEVAAAIAWLMSPDASYTTGAVLRVSGGR